MFAIELVGDWVSRVAGNGRAGVWLKPGIELSLPDCCMPFGMSACGHL